MDASLLRRIWYGYKYKWNRRVSWVKVSIPVHKTCRSVPFSGAANPRRITVLKKKKEQLARTNAITYKTTNN